MKISVSPLKFARPLMSTESGHLGAGSPCQTADARYLINRSEDELHIAGVGMDTCGGRHAALVGVWRKA